MDPQFFPIFNDECEVCDRSPIVGIKEIPQIIRSTKLCGVCFFGTKLMLDWEEWNEPPESSE